jgi:hypothetical protein
MSNFFSKIIHFSKWNYDDIFIYRIIFDKYALNLCNNKLNSIISNNGFSSWTFDLQRALEFVDSSSSNITLLRSKLKKNMSYLYIDGLRKKNTKVWLYQSEILLDKEATFKIKHKSNFKYYNDLMIVSKDDKDFPFNSKIKICLLDIEFIKS